MHSYLRAIGFTGINSIKDENELIREICDHYDEKIIFETEKGRYMGEISRDFGPGIGLTVCGEYSEDGMFFAEYLFPYVKGRYSGVREQVYIEKHVANESYTGACDDLRIGTTLIFYLQNMGEYMRLDNQYLDMFAPKNVTLSGMSMNGTILLPSLRDGAKKPSLTKERRNLLKAARDGDEDAMESLSLEEMNTYSMLMERVSHEDVLTIVDSYFMPEGSECEKYSILGTILNHETAKNTLTGEEIAILELDCNDIRLDVCINTRDLVGEIATGRRFKGEIWLQGRVEF